MVLNPSIDNVRSIGYLTIRLNESGQDDSMTTRTLYERAGCLAAELARRAGIPVNTWNGMLKRDTPLYTARSPLRLARLIWATRKKRDELTRLVRDMETLQRKIDGEAG